MIVTGSELLPAARLTDNMKHNTTRCDPRDCVPRFANPRPEYDPIHNLDTPLEAVEVVREKKYAVADRQQGFALHVRHLCEPRAVEKCAVVATQITHAPSGVISYDLGVVSRGAPIVERDRAVRATADRCSAFDRRRDADGA